MLSQVLLETEVLGAMLNDMRKFDYGKSIGVDARVFESELNSMVFHAMGQLYRNDIAPTPQNIKDVILSSPTGKDMVISDMDIEGLFFGGMDEKNNSVYTKELVNNYIEKDYQKKMAELGGLLSTGKIDFDTFQTEVSRLMNERRVKTEGKTEQILTGSDIVTHYEEAFDEADGGYTLTGDMGSIGEWIGSFMPKELIGIAGDTNAGKSAFCANIAKNFAVDQQIPTVILDTEMGIRTYITRIIALMSGIPLFVFKKFKKIKDLKNHPIFGPKYTTAITLLGMVPLYYIDISNAEMENVYAKLEEGANKGGMVFIFDYLGRIQLKENNLQEHQQLARIAKDLKGFAKNRDKMVFAPMQLNRPEKLKGQYVNPTKADIMGSYAMLKELDWLLAYVYLDDTSKNEDNGDHELANVLIKKLKIRDGSGVNTVYCVRRDMNTLAHEGLCERKYAAAMTNNNSMTMEEIKTKDETLKALGF